LAKQSANVDELISVSQLFMSERSGAAQRGGASSFEHRIGSRAILNLSDLTGSKVQRVGKHGPTICVRELARGWRLKWLHLNRRRLLTNHVGEFIGHLNSIHTCRIHRPEPMSMEL
jgi:hypothetical protein